MASALGESQSIRELELAGAHLARRRPAHGTTYFGATDHRVHDGVGVRHHLSPWPLEAILAEAAIAEADLAVDVPPHDVAIGVPIHITSVAAGPVMGIAVDPMRNSASTTNQDANPWRDAAYQAYYDAYYNAYYNHRALQQPPPAQQTETHNTVGITSLRSSDAGLADPEEVSPNAGQRTFRAMLQGSSRGQDNRSDNRRPRICATNNEWRRRCPWAARLQRVERLAAETERLVESVERLGVRFHGAEVGASRHLAELFTNSP